MKHSKWVLALFFPLVASAGLPQPLSLTCQGTAQYKKLDPLGKYGGDHSAVVAANVSMTIVESAQSAEAQVLGLPPELPFAERRLVGYPVNQPVFPYTGFFLTVDFPSSSGGMSIDIDRNSGQAKLKYGFMDDRLLQYEASLKCSPSSRAF